MLRKQLIVFVVFAAMMAAITALSYALSATTDEPGCPGGIIHNPEACR